MKLDDDIVKELFDASTELRDWMELFDFDNAGPVLRFRALIERVEEMQAAKWRLKK
jgi:hypothetical protein